MCRTEITSHYCASPNCESREKPHLETIVYKICIPTHYNDEDYHVDRTNQDPAKIHNAERFQDRRGLCPRCEAIQSLSPGQEQDLSSSITSEHINTDNVVQFGPSASYNSVISSDGDGESTRMISIDPPVPSTACPWLCARLQLSNETCALATQILEAVERGRFDGRHQDHAILGAAVYMAAHLLGERKLKVRELKKCMSGSHNSQIQAAYALLWEKWEGVLRNQVGGGVRYRVDEGRLPRPVRASWAPREHWMM